MTNQTEQEPASSRERVNRHIAARKARGDTRHTVWLSESDRRLLQDAGVNLSAPGALRALLDKAAQADIHATLRAELEAERGRIGELWKEAQLDRARASAIAKGVTAYMTEDEYRLVRGLLHPDRHTEETERYKRGFEIFNRLEQMINPNIPVAVLRKRGWEKRKR